MASNPYPNKLVYYGVVKLDLSDATASASNIQQGYSAYGANGQKLSGTLSFVTYYTGSTNPASSLGSNGDIYLKVVS